MTRFIKKISKTAGLVPGTLVHVGEQKVEKVKITVFDYDSDGFTEKQVHNIEEIGSYKDTGKVIWINIDGAHDIDIIERLGKIFDFHPLMLEDIVNTGQRPKSEEYGKYIFVALKMLYANNGFKDIIFEQVSLVLGRNLVITVQEREGDVFEPVRNRIRQAKGRIRKLGADYLSHSLLDAVVDNYFSILENFGEKVEEIENIVAVNPVPETLKMIHKMKREAILLRKSVWPLREIIHSLQREESELVRKDTIIYYRDLYDHTIQVIDTIEVFRDMLSGMLDIYLSSLSNKMNETMKVLTIFAVIFIPLTFIAGIYGMNFNPQVSVLNMPELNWKYGYISVLGFMAVVAAGMLIYFKKKKWL
ncbi:MAG: magnesium/cobalt transporter CorA [Candidatus Omnitrophota bacterium]